MRFEVEHTRVAGASVHTFLKMATSSSTDVMFDEDMDGILELLDEDFFESDEISSKFLEDVTVNVERGLKSLFVIVVVKFANQNKG